MATGFKVEKFRGDGTDVVARNAQNKYKLTLKQVEHLYDENRNIHILKRSAFQL